MYAREHITLLHLPTTSCILAFVTMGTVIAPTFNVTIFILALLDFFLGAGVASNYLDELCGRPWKTTMPAKDLWIIGMTALTLSLLIGLYLSLLTGIVFLIIVLIESFLVVSYNLELFKGLFHNYLSIAAGGSLAFLGGFYLQHQSLDMLTVIMAIMVGVCSFQGIHLYQVAKPTYRDGKRDILEAIYADRSLRFSILFIDLLAVTMLIIRVIG